MRLSASLGPYEVEKVSIEIMEEWLKSLQAEDNGYRHYYTMRKKHLLEGMVAGVSQETYWLNHGRLADLKYINALSNKLLKNKYESSKKKEKG